MGSGPWSVSTSVVEGSPGAKARGSSFAHERANSRGTLLCGAGPGGFGTREVPSTVGDGFV